MKDKLEDILLSELEYYDQIPQILSLLRTEIEKGLLSDDEMYETECEWLFNWGDVPYKYKVELAQANSLKELTKQHHLLPQRSLAPFANG